MLQVGGGTKTRRPIALRMQYNASCNVPRCFLTLENGVEEMRSLSDIQVSAMQLIYLTRSLCFLSNQSVYMHFIDIH
jgi:hypothetical protein